MDGSTGPRLSAWDLELRVVIARRRGSLGMSEIVVTRNDQGRTIAAHSNDEILFRLDENLSTGYAWEVEPVDSSVIELLDSAHAAAPEVALGRGGSRVVRFAARSAGSQEVRMRLRRPWEPPNSELERFAVTVLVQP